jgi:UDP-2,3-diacylglucosamine hydrolase
MYYFASDVHLGAGDELQARRTEQLFVRWLESVEHDAEAIFLMGDIFDFWFEYSRVIPKGFVRVLGTLARLADKGIAIHFFTGNHDMWCRDYFEKECGMHLHLKGEDVTLAGRHLHLAHGDNLNVGNKPMLRLMNSAFRSSFMRALFSWLVHPNLALRFGKWWSGKSRKSHNSSNITPEALGFLIDAARLTKSASPDVECVIYGHMHLPHIHHEANLSVYFLGNWEDDKGSYAQMDGEGNIELKTFQ